MTPTKFADIGSLVAFHCINQKFYQSFISMLSGYSGCYTFLQSQNLSRPSPRRAAVCSYSTVWQLSNEELALLDTTEVPASSSPGSQRRFDGVVVTCQHPSLDKICIVLADKLGLRQNPRLSGPRWNLYLNTSTNSLSNLGGSLV